MSGAIDAIRKHKTLYEADHGWDKTTLDALDTAIEALRQPQRTEKWIEWVEVSCYGAPPTYVYSCSGCGLKSFGMHNFCPNCGGRWRYQNDHTSK